MVMYELLPLHSQDDSGGDAARDVERRREARERERRRKGKEGSAMR